MSNKLSVLKLLWSNLKYMKLNGKSPDQTFDFLNEDDMIKYLFNEDERYVELLILSLETQPLKMLETLNPKFVKYWLSFWETSKEKSVDETVDLVKEEVKEVVKEEINVVKTVKDDVKNTESNTNIDELSDTTEIDLEDDSMDDSSVDGDSVENTSSLSFINKYLGSEEGSKISLEVIFNKYAEYCENNDMDNDEEELESYLVERFGKPKGKKKPKLLGVKLL